MKSKEKVFVLPVHKPKSQYCVVTGLVSFEGRLFINGKFSLFAFEGNTLRELKTKYQDWNGALVAHGGALLASGDEGAARSTDGGAFQPYKLPADVQIDRLAVDGAGVLWVGGLHDGEGFVAYGPPEKLGGLKRASGALGWVNAMAPSRLGMLIGDRGGRLWVGKDGAVRPLGLDAGLPIVSICETEDGVILVAANEEYEEHAFYRSTDSGVSFVKSTCKVLKQEPVLSLAQIPGGGPIVAGGYGAVLTSFDGGTSFSKTREGKSDQPFSAACVHEGTLYLGGPFQPIVSVSVQGAASAGAAATRATTPAKPAARARSAAGYVGSGAFLKELEAVVGPLAARGKAKEPAWLAAALAGLPPAVADEVYALYNLFKRHRVPALCGLREGGFCSIPQQFDMDEEAVREEEWFARERDVQFMMRAVEIFNDGGNPFLLVAKDGGVYVYWDDPHGYSQIAKDLPSFLRGVLALEAMHRGQLTERDAQKRVPADMRDGELRFVARMGLKSKKVVAKKVVAKKSVAKKVVAKRSAR